MNFLRPPLAAFLCLAAGGGLAGAPATPTAGRGGDDDATARYRKADTDGDGRISRAEFQASVRERKNYWAIGETAANTEQTSATPELFAALDRNGDGYLTKQELEDGRRLREQRGDNGSGASRTRQAHPPGSPQSGSKGKTDIEK
jgi:hypothetical protein